MMLESRRSRCLLPSSVLTPVSKTEQSEGGSEKAECVRDELNDESYFIIS